MSSQNNAAATVSTGRAVVRLEKSANLFAMAYVPTLGFMALSMCNPGDAPVRNALDACVSEEMQLLPSAAIFREQQRRGARDFSMDYETRVVPVFNRVYDNFSSVILRDLDVALHVQELSNQHDFQRAMRTWSAYLGGNGAIATIRAYVYAFAKQRLLVETPPAHG